ncbi:bax inhibitor family protein [Niveomyces insectorum RCEF 264]|uniref:Bax inhibitor family protein n=1 Tax=Niveomyces insectorum RCEF 264 TaxID=1081102 RepID=A0A167T585_9HYPO|nr:bax inhibitor family protein [Niveomyces insectorum RCEF 264]
MASTAKYSPAAAVDPDEHLDYTQAPPSYQTEAGGATRSGAAGAPGDDHFNDEDDDQARLFSGAPRSSEDNLPDDFKFGGSVAEATVDIRNQFVRKVYAILSVQLLATGVLSAVSFFNDGYRVWVQSHPALVFVSLFGSIGFLLLTFWKRRSYPTNLIFLTGFTLLEAYSISVIVSFYNAGVVLNAVVLTAGIFVFLTIFACQTKYDFTSWLPYLFGGLWALILFGFMAMFFPYNSTAELIYGGVTALIFSGYILVDTQLVLRKHHVEEEIAAAISLYLDIINLFLAILRILNSQQNN